MATAMTEPQPTGAALEQMSPVAPLIQKISNDEATREQIQMALPPSVTLDRFTRSTRTALMQNHELAKADQASLFQSIVKCAADGLLPDGVEAALVIYNTKVKDDQGERWVAKVQYLPMIGGVRKIAAEYGWTIRTHVVYANDLFEVEQGTDDRVMHRPVIGGDRGDLFAAYAIAHHRDGRRSITEVMTKADVEKAKSVSKAKDSGPWKQWPAQMWEKTVGHRIAKKLPLDPVDAQRLSRVADAAALGPAESAAALYGPDAKASFGEIPSGAHAYVIHEVPSAETPQTDDQPRPAAGASPGGSDGDASPPIAAAASSVDEGEPVVVIDAPEVDAVDQDVVEADAYAAASYIPPSGQFSAEGQLGPRTLAEILALGEQGEKWLRAMLTRVTAPPEYVQALWAFARVYATEIHTDAAAKREQTS